MVFKIVADNPESAEHDLKIDLAAYPTDERARAAYQDPKLRSTGDKARTAWGWMIAGVEVKFEHARSAFKFGSKGFLRESQEGKNARIQLAKYATQLMLRQHRTFAFIVYISRDKARLTRWDRTGCIASTPIDLILEPEYLLNFIYRLAKMQARERGYDTSAVLATAEELRRFQEYKSVNPIAQQWADDVRKNAKFYPIYKVCIGVSCLLPQADGSLDLHSGFLPESWERQELYLVSNWKAHRCFIFCDRPRYQRLCCIQSQERAPLFFEGLLATHLDQNSF